MVNIIKTAALFIMLVFISTSQLFAQNEDLKYLDDGGYSQIKNFVSIDFPKLIGQSLSIRYERTFGSSFTLTGGIILMSPNHNHKFFVDFMDVYGQDTRDFYPSKPGINPFVEAKIKFNIKESHFLTTGIGYRYYSYQTAYMQDIYGTFGHVYKINTKLFWTIGGDMGIRLIKYTDIEYDPGYISGIILDEYNKWYNDEVHKQTIILRFNLGLGYMF